MTTTTTTKADLLQMICENPGWQPSATLTASARLERELRELCEEGWITRRLDGWEATPTAVDTYPSFALDITTGKVVASAEASLTEQEFERHVEHLCVPLGRVTTLIAAMLREMPIGQVKLLCALTPSQMPQDQTTWKLAHEIAETMR